jgi:hypothetical protein
MISYLAVVFFCAGQECFFWTGKKLHNTEQACINDIAVVVRELEKNGTPSAFQCVRVPITGV